MTLVKSKVRTKLPASEKRRLALHHKKSQNYNKTYWPYLPIVLIFGLGVMYKGSASLHNAAFGASNSASLGQLATTNDKGWSLGLLAILTLVMICGFIYRHSLRVKRAVSNGEKLFVRHYALDLALAVVIVIGFLVSKTNGLI